MTTTTTTGPGRGLDARAPERGAAADCYAVALTTLFLARRPEVTREHGGETRSYGRHLDNAPARHAVTLHRISGRLHRIAENECNFGRPTCTACAGSGRVGNTGDRCPKCGGEGVQDMRGARELERQAIDIAAHYGLRCYFQADPRGCALYLIPPEIVPAVTFRPHQSPELQQYDYERHGARTQPAPNLATLQARWIEANYTRGHAVVRMGR